MGQAEGQDGEARASTPTPEDPREHLRRAIAAHLARGEDAAAELMEILKRKPAPVLALTKPK